MASSLRVRPLTLAAFAPASLVVLVLPFGLLERDVAVMAGLYGLYFALPAVVAWCLDAVRARLRPVIQRTLGGLALLVAVPAMGVSLLWTGPLFIFAVPPTAVVFVVACRLVLARPTNSPTMSRSREPMRAPIPGG